MNAAHAWPVQESSLPIPGYLRPLVAAAALRVLSVAHAEAVPAGEAAPATAAPPDAAQLARELAEVRAEQLRLAERLAAAEQRAQTAAAEERRARPKVPFTVAPGRGLTLALPDERFSITLRARAQIRDTVVAQRGAPTTNEINVKTLRFWVQGNVLTRDLTYAIQLAFGGGDFDNGSQSPIFDAWVDYARLRDLNIRVGQFFVPFDRARTIREFALQLVDRPLLVSELTLYRDVGVSIYSTNLRGLRGILAYHLGFFGGEGRNRFGGAGVGFLYTARFVVRPFGPFDDDMEGDLSRLKRPRLAIAIAGAHNQSTNRSRSTTGTALTLGTIDYAHAAADLVFKIAGVSLLAEVVYRQARQGSFTGTVDSAPARQWSRSGLGYLVQAGVMVHDKVELAARWDQLFSIGQTDPALIAQVAATGKEIGGGLNVYLNGHLFKLQADYQYQFGADLVAGRHAARVQLDASFSCGPQGKPRCGSSSARSRSAPAARSPTPPSSTSPTTRRASSTAT